MTFRSLVLIGHPGWAPCCILSSLRGARVNLSAAPLQVLSGSLDVVLGGPGLDVGPAVVESIRQGELGGDTLNSVCRVDVLDQGDLEASSTALARDDGGVGKEVLPDLYVN